MLMQEAGPGLRTAGKYWKDRNLPVSRDLTTLPQVNPKQKNEGDRQHAAHSP